MVTLAFGCLVIVSKYDYILSYLLTGWKPPGEMALRLSTQHECYVPAS